MPGMLQGSFDSPDESRAPDKTTMDIIDLDGIKIARITFQPGWKWSECIKPVAGTESCQANHVGLVLSGTIHVVHEDGTEGDATAGSAYLIRPGHDAWVVGDEPVVAYEFDSSTAGSYAQSS